MHGDVKKPKKPETSIIENLAEIVSKLDAIYQVLAHLVKMLDRLCKLIDYLRK